MHYIRITLMGLVLLFVLSCKTDEFVTVGSNDPVFSAKFTFDGVSNVLTAGFESYLFTDYHRSNDSVTLFTGTFAEPVCYTANAGNCTKQMDFVLRGFEKNIEAKAADFTLRDYPFSNIYAAFDSISGTPIANVDNSNFGKAAIRWTDANGVLWQSDLLPQSNSKFTISAKESYLTNDRGQNTLKMDITFKCLLYNSDFVSKTLEGTAMIAIGTP
jgi:hypothetical protein